MFSSQSEDEATVRKTIDSVTQIVQDQGFSLNQKAAKRKVLRRHQQHSVCGVTLKSGKLTISCRKRRQLKAEKHKLALGQKAALSQRQLQGWDAYVNMIPNR